MDIIDLLFRCVLCCIILVNIKYLGEFSCFYSRPNSSNPGPPPPTSIFPYKGELHPLSLLFLGFCTPHCGERTWHLGYHIRALCLLVPQLGVLLTQGPHRAGFLSYSFLSILYEIFLSHPLFPCLRKKTTWKKRHHCTLSSSKVPGKYVMNKGPRT